MEWNLEHVTWIVFFFYSKGLFYWIKLCVQTGPFQNTKDNLHLKNKLLNLFPFKGLFADVGMSVFFCSRVRFKSIEQKKQDRSGTKLKHLIAWIYDTTVNVTGATL